MRLKVVGLGTAAMDVVLYCDSFPGPDGFAFVREERLTAGGSCANVLAALNSWGVPTELVAKIGQDTYGLAFYRDLQDQGIGCRHVITVPEGTTLHTFIAVNQSGARMIFANLGNTLLALSEDEVGLHCLEEAAVFYTDMFPGKPALKLARISRENNVPVVFNLQCPPSFMALCGVGRPAIEEMTGLASLVVGSREGITELAGEEDLTLAVRRINDLGRPACGVICTLGQEGAVWLCGGELLHIPPYEVDAVDSTGAGDAFVAGLILALWYRDLAPKEAGRFAAACAALKCKQPGPRLTAKEDDIWNFVKNTKEEDNR